MAHNIIFGDNKHNIVYFQSFWQYTKYFERNGRRAYLLYVSTSRLEMCQFHMCRLFTKRVKVLLTPRRQFPLNNKNITSTQNNSFIQ